MVIPNPVIKLDYDPARDVLSVEWPDVHDYMKSETVYTLDKVVEVIKLYDVKYLLADTRKGVVDISEPEYKEIILKFARGLAETRLRKIARVVTGSTLREGPIHEVTKQAHLLIPMRNFYSTEDALGWLTSRYDCL
ncbi:hypothetical protein [Pontibacter pamirensis]|uniref:hypothetical protein n=1 Tax=Pontibacter pamirensis TaxID=2562824 RepID=UPI0013895266|nr:hypothetical protein [Pontibacter pamirensis]